MADLPSDTFALSFAPEHWSQLRRFTHFIGPPLGHREVEKGARTTENHLRKYEVLASLAQRIVPTLVDDHAELERTGHTPATRSAEFAALVETLVCELYASLDGVRRALFGAYHGVRKVQNSSTRDLFKLAAAHAYGKEFPEDIGHALSESYESWFLDLRKLRSEITHGELGSCYLEHSTGRVRYMHMGLGTPERALVIDDIVGRLNSFATNVFDLVERVFLHLYLRLDSVERRVMCGIYKGRMYERVATPDPILTFNSGRCVSQTWFEKEPELLCPLRQRCGAYRAPASLSDAQPSTD